MAERALVAGGSHGLATGQGQVGQEPAAVGSRAGPCQVMDDLRRLAVEIVGVEPFECVGDQQVEPPASGVGQPGQ